MSLTWTTYLNSIQNLMPVSSTTQANFVVMVPNMIDDAEQRLYRELDLLDTVVTDPNGTFITNQRVASLPATSGTFKVVNTIYAITPAGATAGTVGSVRNSLVPASRDFLDFIYPSVNGSTVPAYFAMTTETSIIVAPWPDQAYSFEVNGTIRPAPLGSSNLTTILSIYFPDCLIAASMVFASGYMKNYGAAVDDPQQGVTWEQHLQKLLQSAHVEEARKKFTSQGWGSKEPAQFATPPRT